MVFLDFFRVFGAPKLHWVYPKDQLGIGSAYIPNRGESMGQTCLNVLKVVFNLGLYTSPLYISYLLRRVESYRQNPRSFAEVCMLISCVYAAGYCFRAFGRLANNDYMEFYRVLRASTKAGKFDTAKKSALSQYDCDFSAWPVEFSMLNLTGDSKRQRHFVHPPPLSWSDSVLKFPQRVVGWAMINTFGFKMIYPGSVHTLQFFMAPTLAENRANLVSNRKGERFKLETIERNEIDSMFFDKRGKTDQGEYLVITCEGNAGFYEMGMLQVPLEAGYSVIGWNHPGFWGSTGSPFPRQDANAADAVMQFAINNLGFPVEKIVIYGWSIGGYTTSWIAMNYPSVHAVIVDATFDHITPLAIEKMPSFLESTVRQAVSDNFNLNVAEQLAEYPGPVRLIKRAKDEMITTDETQLASSNRGNDLLVYLLQKRYPKLFTDAESEVQLREYVSREKSAREAMLASRGVEWSAIEKQFFQYTKENGKDFPMNIGERASTDDKVNMLLFLVTKYLTEYDATHCIPLPSSLFILPWNHQ